MKTVKNKSVWAVLVMISLLTTSCLNELNVDPVVENTFENLIAKDPNAAKGILAKMYASYTLAGNEGPGTSELKGDDAGESPFLRGIFNLQELTTDMAKNRWGDDGLDQLTTNTKWDENNKFFRYTYNRIYFTVAQCNNFINVLNSVSVAEKDSYIAETKFLRALAYFYLIDFYGKGALVTEADFGSSETKAEASRKEIFDYVVADLKSIEEQIPLKNEYGRANRSAVRMLLAKLYLNSEVYTGQKQYEEALTYVKKIIEGNEGGYALADKYLSVFSGDNNTSTEIIFPLVCDAQTSQSFGNTTYITNGSANSETMTLSEFGLQDGWAGHRTTKGLYGLFGNLATSTDQRAKLFFTRGHNYEMEDYKKWTDGYPSTKFRNANFNSPTVIAGFSNVDFPVFRISDAYLMYAEAVLRGATGGTAAQALTYVNAIRTKRTATPITASDLTLNFILDERGRELSFEGHRRTDLIRFGRFTGGTYLWPWKGGVAAGTSIPDTYKVFPIPLTALQANPKLTQNAGY
jgi:starch-binding outer membrane protein, SusD/RagB family